MEVMSVFGPVVFPLVVGADGAELAEGMSVFFGPPRPRLLEAGLEDMAVAAFDQAGADRQVVGQGVGIVELVGAVLEVAQRGTHGGLVVGDVRGLRAGPQGGEDRGVIAGAQGLAQRGDKGFGVGGVGRGRGQILTDVEQVDGVAAVGPELLPGLLGDPRGPVAERMDLGLQPPAGRSRP